MSHCMCIGGLVVIADAAAWVVSAQTEDNRWVVLITSGTTVVVAICGALVFLAPHVGRAITTMGASILPALAAIRHQNEELNKGTLSEQLERLAEQNTRLAEQNTRLQEAVDEDKASTDRARTTLHDLRNQFNNATLEHRLQRDTLIAEVGALTKSLDEARREIAESHARDQARLNTVDAGQVRQDAQISETKAAVSENRAAIRETKAVVKETAAAVERIAGSSSTEIPVVKLDEGGAAG
jgi:DNA repair exonuclease SbcCD ATPase subunit